MPRAQRVHDIETAAREVFCARGYADASLAEIAAKAGVAEGTVYNFFATKRELVISVIERWYESMFLAFENHLPGIANAREKVRFIIRHHLKSLTDNPDLARLCSNEVRNGGDYYHSALHTLNKRYSKVLVKVIQDGIANGEFRQDLPATLVRDIIFGGIEHHVSGVLYGKSRIDLEKSASDIFDVVMKGSAPDLSRESGSIRGDVALSDVLHAVQRIESHINAQKGENSLARSVSSRYRRHDRMKSKSRVV